MVVQYTKQLAQFLDDAQAAGYTFARSSSNENLIYLGIGRDAGFVRRAQIYLVTRDGKIRFGKAEPLGGATRLEDFWTMKALRRMFKIPVGESAQD